MIRQRRRLTFLESYWLFITLINLWNIRKSPGYNPHTRIISLVRLTLFSLVKGVVYGIFFPISLSVIGYDLICDDTPGLSNIMRHAIPMSRYLLPFSANFK